jgi:arginine-tRNA-protein transferase
MAAMDAFDYQMMVEDSPITTYLLELRQPDGEDEGRLLAACITDVTGDGLSMVYSFFDPKEQRRSLGTYMILRHIELAREMGLSYVYLGYWIEGSRKMQYKARFRPLELLGPGGWESYSGPEVTAG